MRASQKCEAFFVFCHSDEGGISTVMKNEIPPSSE